MTTLVSRSSRCGAPARSPLCQEGQGQATCGCRPSSCSSST